MDKNQDSCLSCRIITIACLFGISGYIFYQGKVQTKSRYPLFILGTAIGALGIGEIFDKSPFRNTSNT